MTLFSRFVLPLIMLGSNLSASLTSPQDPAFLDGFNAQQKNAIYQFFSQELGKGTDEPNDSGFVNQNEGSPFASDLQLKEFYLEYLRGLSDNLGIHLSPKRKQHDETETWASQQGCDHCATVLKNLEERELKAAQSRAIPIHPTDINTNGIVIDKPGYYYLNTKRGIFNWKPSNTSDAITIDADNVFLDLNHNTIKQVASSNVASRAIHIRPDHKNITIRNGSLVGFTADAILANSTSQLLLKNISIANNINRNAYSPDSSFASVNIRSCLNVVLRNVNISNTVVNSGNTILGAGILLLNTSTFLVKNCEVVKAKVEANTVSQCVGISNILSQNGVIDNCRVSECESSGIMPGFGYVISQSILSKNCIANNNKGVQTTSGYYPQISDSLQFINCEASNNQSTCQDCHGFPYFISTNGFFSNCRALNNQAVNPFGGFNEKTTGFEILVCRNCTIEDCVAANNIATNPIRHYAAGFANGNSSNVVFRNCISMGNMAIGNTSRGVGFGPALDPRFFASCFGTIWDNCVAEGNFGDAQSIGFDLFGQIGPILTGSISQNHGGLIPNGIGIVSDGSYDEGNPVDVPCDVVPIIVLTNNTENNALVKDNTVTNNTFAGILDTTGANNVYINNTVFNNGTNFVGSIFGTGTPIRDWTVQSAPSNANNNGVVGDKLDNLNITTP